MMKCSLIMLVVLVSAQDMNNKLEFDAITSCPISRGCSQNKCCTNFACDEQDIIHRKKTIKCCSKGELIAEQQQPAENQVCSPCVKCSKYLLTYVIFNDSLLTLTRSVLQVIGESHFRQRLS